jgi:hypothetical protein
VSILRFESEEALRFGITSGLVPEGVLAAAARTWRDETGAILVAPARAVPARAMERLVAAGVGRLDASAVSPSAASVRCWAEIVGLARARDVDADVGRVLFVVPEDAAFVDVAGELIRLGCDRIEWRSTSAGFLLRASEPPYYSILRATDPTRRVRAYAQAPRGQDSVWVEIGWEHPLARFLRPEAGSLLLVSPADAGADACGASFTTVSEGPFEDVYTLVDLSVPAGGERREHPAGEAPRLRVTLRLARAASIDAPSLWVIRDDAVRKIERLLASLPEEDARSLLFSVCRDGDVTMVVVRLRPGARSNVEIDDEAYRAHSSIANLFLPCDATLEPPLRRDHVRDMLAPNADDVVWLRPLDGGRFQVERVADDAFHPLSDWVEYVIDTSAAALIPWVKSATFDFDAFVGADPAETGRRVEPEEPQTPRRAERAEPGPPQATTRAPSDLTRRERALRERAPERPTLTAARVHASAAAEQLAAIEKEFFALDAPAGDPVRSALWERMAALNTSLRRAHDAALCWARVAWEVASGEHNPAVAAWREAERALVGGVSAETLLAQKDPSRAHVRALAVELVHGGDPALRKRAQEASLWLDRHDHLLDVRTAWLARVAVASLVGGDRLGLARARDRLLSKIQRGLSFERDVPSFMRRAGAGRDAAQVELLARRLDGLLETFERTRRKRSATEADPKLTGAYVRFVVAYGAARLGRNERALELRDAALKVLPKDPVHDLLSRGYVARIAQALEGLPPEMPLPPEVSAGLNGLSRLDRYKVDRVRQWSKILEPQERLDPIMAFQRGEADPRGPELAALRGETDRTVVEERVAAIMAKARTSAPEERARLYDGVMDFFPMISHARALGHLEALVANVDDVQPIRRVQLYEEALMLAGLFGDEGLARRIFDVLEPIVAAVGPDDAAAIAPLASGMLRTLRRFGLREEAQRLLGALQQAARGRAAAHLVARLHTAAALAYLGEMERARPVFEDSLATLAGELPLPDRLKVTRALAWALGAAPLEYAVAGLDELPNRLEVVTDSFNTNSHLCLSVLDFMEALVLGYASDDLAIDHVARRFLDEDEYLVRRRIHRDLAMRE